MSDLEQTIADVAAGPAEVRSDAGSIKQQTLGDLIAADQYLTRKAISDPLACLTFVDIEQGGAV